MKIVEVSKEDLKYNITALKNIIEQKGKDDKGEKTQIIAVVKGNGMGLGLIPFSKFLLKNGIRFLAVATISELLELREAKIDCPILMLTPTGNKSEIKTLIENKAILTIGSLEEMELTEKILEEKNEEIEAHIKIDTGMGRYGFISDNDDILTCFEKSKKVHITGTYTHFSKPIDEKWTRKQFDNFLDVVAGIRQAGFDPGLLHVSATTATIKYRDMSLNAVRVGSFFQGRTLFPELNLKKVGFLKTQITEIKELPAGYNISYSNTYKLKNKSKVAVIPVGYKDGLFLNKSRDDFSFKTNIIAVLMEIKKIFKDNYLKVEINNKQYKIIGRVGMYHAIVDITGSDVNLGDEVIIRIPPLEISDNIKREFN